MTSRASSSHAAQKPRWGQRFRASWTPLSHRPRRRALPLREE
jgi:hypothetical protein